MTFDTFRASLWLVPSLVLCAGLQAGCTTPQRVESGDTGTAMDANLARDGNVDRTDAPGADAPAGDTGAPIGDVGTIDGASVDAATVDAPGSDAATVDAASVDAASVDAARVDAAAVDASGPRDACVPEPMATTCSGHCGLTANNCGASVMCSLTCGRPQTCGGGGVPGVCGCTAADPDPCATAGLVCGSLTDSCGVSHSCGRCAGICCGDSCVCARCACP